jgi:hypothetical protein
MGVLTVRVLNPHKCSKYSTMKRIGNSLFGVRATRFRFRQFALQIPRESRAGLHLPVRVLST